MFSPPKETAKAAITGANAVNAANSVPRHQNRVSLQSGTTKQIFLLIFGFLLSILQQNRPAPVASSM